jgi:hypothetical protein
MVDKFIVFRFSKFVEHLGNGRFLIYTYCTYVSIMSIMTFCLLEEVCTLIFKFRRLLTIFGEFISQLRRVVDHNFIIN